jgi:putative transposase
MAATAVQRRGISIAMACRTFGVSETCHRNSPLLSDENEQIADLHIIESIEEAQDFATQ